MTILSRRPELHDLVAGAVVIRKQSLTTAHPETLLVRRSPGDFFPLRWEYAGGGFDIDSDKNLANTALRELREETGLAWSTVMSFAPSSHILDDQAWGIATFLVEYSDEDVKIDKAEHVEWAWVTEKEVRAEKFSTGDHRMEILSKEMKDMILEGFRLAKALKR